MPASTQLDRQEAEEMLRVLHQHGRGHPDIERLASMIHPEAEMRLVIGFGVELHGRDAIVKALRSAHRNAEMYSLTVRRFEWLDDQTVLTFGRGRYALQGGGFAEGRLYWLDSFLDGVIYRAHVFMQEAGARRVYEEELERHSQTP